MRDILRFFFTVEVVFFTGETATAVAGSGVVDAADAGVSGDSVIGDSPTARPFATLLTSMANPAGGPIVDTGRCRDNDGCDSIRMDDVRGKLRRDDARGMSVVLLPFGLRMLALNDCGRLGIFGMVNMALRMMSRFIDQFMREDERVKRERVVSLTFEVSVQELACNNFSSRHTALIRSCQAVTLMSRLRFPVVHATCHTRELAS